MSSNITLSARNLNRHLGRRQIIRNVSLQLRRGEVLGLLGHNGAGKSTTMQLLTGTLIPDSGEIEICGHDLQKQPAQAKACIGYLPENPPLYRDMRVDDFLTFAARLRNMPAASIPLALAEAMRRCGLEEVGRKIIGTLSKGYQQRVGIAQAIIHNPDVIILDEPTVGLDPAQIRDIRTLIRELGSAHSVLLSTHLLSEAETICDRVEIMQHGQLIYGDTSVRMRRFGHQPGFMVTLLAPPPLTELQAISGVQSAEAVSATRFRILHDASNNPAAALLQLAAERGWQAQQLTPLQGSMEDAFVQLTQQQPSMEAS